MKWVTRERARVDRMGIAKDDHDNMAKQFPAYDALYAYCRSMAGRAST